MLEQTNQNMNYVKLTSYICTFLLFFIAIYDGLAIFLSGNIDASVSVWFATFGSAFVPMFSLSFLLGHFFGTRPDKNAPKPAHMIPWKFAITVTCIVASLYDILALKFFNPNHAISSIYPLPALAEWPILVIICGAICGKYLGTMSPVRPAGSKYD